MASKQNRIKEENSEATKCPETDPRGLFFIGERGESDTIEYLSKAIFARISGKIKKIKKENAKI
jgi:hypothetical protein